MLTIKKTIPPDSRSKQDNPFSPIDLFHKIPPQELEKKENQVLEKIFKRGEFIYLENDPASRLWFVKEGYVKLGHHSLEGRTKTFCMKGPLGVFGVSALGREEYGVYAMAETDSTVVSIPVVVLHNLCQRYPEIAKAFVFHLSRLLREAKEVESFSSESAESRLIHTLFVLRGNFGNTIPLTRKEISEIAGTSVETCIRGFKRLEKDGLVAAAHGKITVKDFDGMMDRMYEV